jgi:hypothetical protein
MFVCGIVYEREWYTVEHVIRWIFGLERNVNFEREIAERERFLARDSDSFTNSKHVKFVLTFTYLRI